MGATTFAQYPAQTAQTSGTLPRSGSSTLAKCLLRGIGANLDGLSPKESEPKSDSTPLTGEPDAGNLPVRFGGRGGTRVSSLPLSQQLIQTSGRAPNRPVRQSWPRSLPR